MRISDWSSDVCSSDLPAQAGGSRRGDAALQQRHQGNRDRPSREKASACSMTNTPALTRTPLLKFAARAPFRFRQHNTGEKALQIGRGGETFYTNSDQFANRVVVPAPKQFRVDRKSTRLNSSH